MTELSSLPLTGSAPTNANAAILVDLQSLVASKRLAAIQQLQTLPSSSEGIVAALLKIREEDSSAEVRQAAAAALKKSKHQPFVSVMQPPAYLNTARPRFIPIYVVLAAIGGLLVLVNFFASNPGPGGVLFMLLAAGVQIALIVGVWQQRTWAAKTAIVVHSLSLVVSLLAGNLLGALIAGTCIYWFATHQDDFQN